MSRKRRAARGPSRHRSLRVRLVVITSTLLLIALAAFAVVSFGVLRQALVSQARETLELANDNASSQLAATMEATGALPGYDDFGPVPPNEGFYAVIQAGHSPLSAYLNRQYDYRKLTSNEIAQLWAKRDVAERGGAITLEGLGRFFVSSSHVYADDGSDLLVVSGVSLANANAVSAAYILSVSSVGLIIAAASAVVGSRMVRGALRPLDRVVAVADLVSQTPLDSGEVALHGRVPRDSKHEGSEADRVGEALNSMLTHVETSLNTRHRSEESMRRFIAEASHELRNPLASIRGYADFYADPHAEERPSRAELTGALERISAESARMSTLVEDLLTLARLDARIEVRRDEVELSRVLVESFADMRMAHPEHRWRLFLPDEPLTVCGEEDAIRQLLLNLLGNAGRHTPAGTEVRLGLEAGPAGIVVTVADDGPGIPEEALPTLFDRFTQADAATRERSSVGLGLAIVRALADAAGYEVSVTSSRDAAAHGTTFTVVIPTSIPAAVTSTPDRAA